MHIAIKSTLTHIWLKLFFIATFRFHSRKLFIRHCQPRHCKESHTRVPPMHGAFTGMLRLLPFAWRAMWTFANCSIDYKRAHFCWLLVLRCLFESRSVCYMNRTGLCLSLSSKFIMFLLMLLKAKFGAVFINFSPLSGFCVDKLTLLGLLFVSVSLAVRCKCF